jgi:subtilisin family serine protease
MDVNALDWLLSQNVQVINMSVGGPRNLLVDIAIQRTIKSGIPVIAAAGNGGHNAAAVYPAAQQDVIAVTAVDSEMNIYSKANYGEYIDFAAPGVDIWAGNEKGAGKFVSGTSFSVPFVTAAMACFINKIDHKEAYLQLQKNAKDLGVKGKDKQFGWGIVEIKVAWQ